MASRRAPLFGGDEDEAGGVELEAAAVEIAEQLDPRPPLGAQHAVELVRGVQTEFGLSQTAVPVLEPPLAVDPARREIDPVLDGHLPRRQRVGLIGGAGADEVVAVPGGSRT